MTTLRLDTRSALDIIAPGGLPFSTDITIGPGDVDYSALLGFWNIGSPDDAEVALRLGTTASGEAVGGVGIMTLSLAKDVMQSLPRRPLPYECWLESIDGTTVVQVAHGRFVVQPTVGSGGLPEPDLEGSEVVDGGNP